LQIKNKIYIEPRVSIAPNVTIMLSVHPNHSKLRKLIKPIKGDVIIGEDSWVGSNVIIYPGITIGKCAVLAAGSVITKDVESYTIVAGIPAKILRKIKPLDLDIEESDITKGEDFMTTNQHNYQWDIENPKGYNNRSGFYKTKVEYAFIKSHISNNQKTILDMGGGSGRFALPLIKAGYDVTVVDLDSNAIELCKKRGITKSYCSDIRNFELNGFDIVLAIELFLVTPPEIVFEIANQKLAKDGLFIFVANNKDSWRYKLHTSRTNVSKNYGELSVKEYENLLVKNRFCIIDIKGFNWLPFKVSSNNILIPLFSKIESFFRLYKWLGQSPWLLFACKKGYTLN
jgi:2-polyprenyl-3-methyl-5-hydroxy-6-metoxy-1,4-benzoquinol methylase